MTAPVYDCPEQSTARAREVAAWFLIEVAAHRLDPVVSVEALFDEVTITVDPASRPVWDTWSYLIKADLPWLERDGSAVVALGQWRNVGVLIRGLHWDRWWQ